MTQIKRMYFGTDGIRGRVGSGPITPDFMIKLGWAIGSVLGRGEKARVVIGKDTRISGYMLESALESGLAAAGVDVVLLGPLPTPGIAYITKLLNADAGIVISASHNPYYDNGIKLFSPDGNKLSDAIEHAIEQLCLQNIEVVGAERLGKASRLHDAVPLYSEFCNQAFSSLNLTGMSCVVDCANGATYQIAPEVLRRTGLHVEPIHITPDGLNINHDCGSTHPQILQQTVIAKQADFGIAFDGDGDRVLFVDHQGQLIDGDQLLYIIALHRLQSSKLKGGVVGTLMSNFGLELALRDLDIEFERAKVGDRYVLQTLAEKGWQLGGESSGHLIDLDKSSTGDGILSALQVLTAIQASGKCLADLAKGMTKFPQILLNVPLSGNQDPMKHPSIQKVVKDAERELDKEGRVLLRCSGTEPLLRVMVEGRCEQHVGQLAQSIVNVVENVVQETEVV